MGFIIYPPYDPTKGQITLSGLVTNAGDLVADRFATAETYGNEMWVEARELLEALGNTEYPVDIDNMIDPWADVDDGGLGAVNPVDPPDPNIDDGIVVDIPPFTTPAPTMPDISIDIDPAPNFDVTDPGFDVPSPPDVTFPIFSDTAPTISSPSIPSPPTYDLPAVPDVTGVSIPSPPEFNVPDFDAVEPVVDLTPPEPLFVWNEAEYNSDIRNQLATKLLADLINGGSGLDSDTEQAIYDRATARQELENNQAYDEALSFFSSRGWRIPPGALAGRLSEVSYRITQVREDLNNDILIQQSKLAQENTHFIIDRAIAQEKNLMDYINVYQQRAFEAAKYVVESALVIYQIKVEAYKAQLEVYKAKAEVYEARIRAEVVKAELYKAQIEGLKLNVDVQRLMIEAYTAQVQAILTLIEIYKAEMEGAKIQAEVDKTRIQSFGILVEAYKARVGAVTERYKAYQAQISGEVAKAEMYTAQVNGYKAKVEAYKAKADVEIAEVQAEVELNRGKVESFKAEIEKFKALVDAAVEQAKAEVEIEKLDVAVYEAQIKKYTEQVEALSKAYLGKIEEAKAKSDVQIRHVEAIIKATVAKYGLVEGASEAAAKIYAQLIASSLSMVSATASLGYEESRRDSTSVSASTSKSSSNTDSYSVSYNYNKELD